MNWTEITGFLESNRQLLWQRTGEHLELMFVAVLAATLVGLPAGVVAARIRRLATPLITLANIVQTIPSVALLGFLLPICGIGRGTAIIALFLYALLPIVRNTIAGLQGVAPSVVDAARGMGMSERQVLLKVELPLALPVIFAGIRTAAVINVGVTTLSALIGAGGLGTFIFRGLATNNMAVILLGAVPAAVLALLADGLLALGERGLRRRAGWIVAAALLAVMVGGLTFRALDARRPVSELRFGFTAEFMERPDGYAAWRMHYGLPPLSCRELDPGLLYDALKLGEVDVACGFSTDGRIEDYGLRRLDDDRHFFPAYEAAILARQPVLDRHPEIAALIAQLGGSIDETAMRRMNLRVDRDKLTPRQVAAEFLAAWAPTAGVAWDAGRAGRPDEPSPDLRIGTKNFTEQYVLGQILCQLINGASSLRATLQAGLGGTSICFEALVRGDIDLYPEYSGTLLSAVLRLSAAELDRLMHDRVAADLRLKEELAGRHGITWFVPLGFNNTYAMLVRGDDPQFRSGGKISDLRTLLPAAPVSPES
ncbi:MAG: ABC transporter permease/substrate-binding protein [Opitutaceae bacterium]|nr:ABC transporter permease/substrate-binding protein [Opitutaceae bacterium]